MTDRNDELLLKIGWKYAVIEHDIDGVIHPRVRWTSPKGKVFGDGPIGTPSIGKLPRPYDSVGDAIACVPSGWVIKYFEGPYPKKYRPHDFGVMSCRVHLVELGVWRPRTVIGLDATPSEALAEAIRKAIEHE